MGQYRIHASQAIQASGLTFTLILYSFLAHYFLPALKVRLIYAILERWMSLEC
jgi:hypothetical protein